MHRLIPVSFILDDLCAVVDAARASVTDERWLKAIDRAWDYLLNQDTVSWDADTHALTVESASEAGVFYTANGECQCDAYAAHKACWHRAAARLVRRALERYGERVIEAAPAPAVYRSVRAMVNPFLPPTTGGPAAGKTAQEEVDELFAEAR